MTGSKLQQYIWSTQVFCSLHFQHIHDVSKTPDTAKALTTVIYGSLLLLVNLFISEILTNARKSSMSYYSILTLQKKLPSVYLPGLGIKPQQMDKE